MSRVSLFSLAALGLALVAARTAEAVEKQPNVVVVVADDWSWPHAGAYGDRVVKTPAFDRVVKEGVRFTNAFCAAPSCTASRGAILTGQAPHRLENGGNLWSMLPRKFAVYPDRLEAAGYVVGLTGKGWGPGTLEGSGRARNPAGTSVKDFDTFLKGVPTGKPFCYWYGSLDPHRPYDPGSGARAGLDPAAVAVPPYLPDTPEIRADLLDYYFEVQRFDGAVGAILDALDSAGLADDTLLIVTSDNGMPFPRCKATLYDGGTHVPLAIRWPRRLAKGVTSRAFVGLADLAPTILRSVGLDPPAEMTGRDLTPLMLASAEAPPPARRGEVFLERERHANVRAGDLGYPSRAVRTDRYLYIRNLRPDRWPAGDPVLVHSVGPFGDVDPSPTKDLILAHRAERAFASFFRLAFEKRRAEELYDLTLDPFQLKNITGHKSYAIAQADLRNRLDRWMATTADPLAHDPNPAGREPFDDYPYVGPAATAGRP